MLRDVITVDEDKCTGCGQCIPGCPEGALQIIDGKARLVSDLMCDGLGACLGECPEGALSVEKKEAQAYDEKKVMVNIIKAGSGTIKAHLAHLKKHGETNYFNQAIAALKENNLNPDDYSEEKKEKDCTHSSHGGCPGARVIDRRNDTPADNAGSGNDTTSQLRQWPVQMHLISPSAPYFKNADVVIAADCVAFAAGNFHSAYLKGKAIAIACPKLDDGQDEYIKKITHLIDEAMVNTITVIMMQVPCCGGLLQMVKQAAGKAVRKVPIKAVIISLEGKQLSENWV